VTYDFSGMTVTTQRTRALVTVKVLHTVVWAFFVVCIVAIPVAGLFRRFGLAWILTGLVLLECGILLGNGGRCPLTDVAGRFTEERRPDFDIYLPVWVARWNKVLFGALFVVGVIFTVWLRFRSM
jgi:hypothetical protein